MVSLEDSARDLSRTVEQMVSKGAGTDAVSLLQEKKLLSHEGEEWTFASGTKHCNKDDRNVRCVVLAIKSHALNEYASSLARASSYAYLKIGLSRSSILAFFDLDLLCSSWGILEVHLPHGVARWKRFAIGSF